MASSSPTSLPFRTADMLPDTLASSTSRPDTQETAAYAASQPLFDVLRGAISRIDEQKQHLTGAKDTVQHIHVKIPQEHVENNGTLRDDYRDALVTAWKVTTESYVRIFEQLCELTGPDPASGRAAEDSYAGFQKLLYTAEAARTVAFEQDAANTKADSGSESESSAAPSKVTTPNKNKQTPATVASSKRAAPSESSPPQQDVQRPVKKQRTTTSEASSTPAAEKLTSQTKEQPSASTAQRLKPKQIRKERKQRIQAHREQQEQQAAAAAMPPPAAAVQPPQPTTVIQAQYADVSAEVDARLRAKEEQKKAKKQAKKRKRDSQGSHILEAEPGAEKEAAEARRKILAQKPAKKRSKSENGEGVRVDGEKNPQAKGKRGAQDESAQVIGARRSKRKKM